MLARKPEAPGNGRDNGVACVSWSLKLARAARSRARKCRGPLLIGDYLETNFVGEEEIPKDGQATKQEEAEANLENLSDS